MRTALAAIVLAATMFLPLDGIAPAIRVAGGIAPNGISVPLLFTWNAALPITGAGWQPGETIRLVLHGPITPPASVRRASRVSPRLGPIHGGREPIDFSTAFTADIALANVTADQQGNFSASPAIPYDNGVVGPQARIPRPGYYEVVALGSVSGAAIAAARINLAPDTYKPSGAKNDWGTDRGGRVGVFPDPISQFSPERMDPEWPTVWDETPVEVYGAIVSTGSNGSDQPARISPSDNPPTHYAHDSIAFLTPDPTYRWLVGTANYYDGDPDSPGRGTLELEWETRNGGSTSSYGQGNIGVPVWVHPSIGDRVYAVGRWIVDAGHPELGDRTEMHPPRLMATMRARPALSNGAAAAQVDIYVSGHGGGANSMPPGLSAILDQGGWGGGRIRDVLTPAEQDRYYRPGPLSTFLGPLVTQLISSLAGVTISGTIYPDAGPSAFPWGAPGPEERPINDRDYDFDVPLPPPPPGATAARVEAVTHAEHTTGVVETVTFRGAVAHVHLPYRGADNGIYARTLKFSWTNGAPPPVHRVVRLTRIDINDSPGKWQLWSDVAGQWSYLSGAAPALLNTTAGQSVDLPGAPVDVYLNPGQSLHVYVNGYRATCIDDFFGKLFGQSAYAAGLTFVAQCGPVDNQDLGGAVFDLPAPAAGGTFTVGATDAAGARHFTLALSVDRQ